MEEPITGISLPSPSPIRPRDVGVSAGIVVVKMSQRPGFRPFAHGPDWQQQWKHPAIYESSEPDRADRVGLTPPPSRHAQVVWPPRYVLQGERLNPPSRRRASA